MGWALLIQSFAFLKDRKIMHHSIHKWKSCSEPMPYGPHIDWYQCQLHQLLPPDPFSHTWWLANLLAQLALTVELHIVGMEGCSPKHIATQNPDTEVKFFLAASAIQLLISASSGMAQGSGKYVCPSLKTWILESSCGCQSRRLSCCNQ